MYLTSLDRRIAQLYPISEWRVNEEFLDSFQDDPQASSNISFNANDLGADVEMDGQSRIVVHPDMRPELGKQGQQMNINANKRNLQIITEERYQEQKRQALENTATNLTVLRRAGLR